MSVVIAMRLAGNRSIKCLVSEITMMFADGACEVRSRSEEEAMQGHRRRQATKRCNATHFRPKGYCGTGSSAVLALLDNVQTLPALRRLVSDPAAPVTRSHLLLGQTLSRSLEE